MHIMSNCVTNLNHVIQNRFFILHAHLYITFAWSEAFYISSTPRCFLAISSTGSLGLLAACKGKQVNLMKLSFFKYMIHSPVFNNNKYCLYYQWKLCSSPWAMRLMITVLDLYVLVKMTILYNMFLNYSDMSQCLCHLLHSQ